MLKDKTVLQRRPNLSIFTKIRHPVKKISISGWQTLILLIPTNMGI